MIGKIVTTVGSLPTIAKSVLTQGGDGLLELTSAVAATLSETAQPMLVATAVVMVLFLSAVFIDRRGLEKMFWSTRKAGARSGDHTSPLSSRSTSPRIVTAASTTSPAAAAVKSAGAVPSINNAQVPPGWEAHMTASPHASTVTAKMGCGPSFEFVRISNWVISGVFTISLSYCALHMRDASGGSDAKSFLGNFKLVFIVCCMAFFYLLGCFSISVLQQQQAPQPVDHSAAMDEQMAPVTTSSTHRKALSDDMEVKTADSVDSDVARHEVAVMEDDHASITDGDDMMDELCMRYATKPTAKRQPAPAGGATGPVKREPAAHQGFRDELFDEMNMRYASKPLSPATSAPNTPRKAVQDSDAALLFVQNPPSDSSGSWVFLLALALLSPVIFTLLSAVISRSDFHARVLAGTASIRASAGDLSGTTDAAAATAAAAATKFDALPADNAFSAVSLLSLLWSLRVADLPGGSLLMRALGALMKGLRTCEQYAALPIGSLQTTAFGLLLLAFGRAVLYVYDMLLGFGADSVPTTSSRPSSHSTVRPASSSAATVNPNRATVDTDVRTYTEAAVVPVTSSHPPALSSVAPPPSPFEEVGSLPPAVSPVVGVADKAPSLFRLWWESYPWVRRAAPSEPWHYNTKYLEHARSLEYRQLTCFPPFYPFGWYKVCNVADLPVGAVKPIKALGLQLVVFRGESGKAAVMDAYCPHLGANLGVGGRVVGDCVECPFHGWQFNTEGQCTSIPYCDRAPPRQASLRTYPVDEYYDGVYMWYDAEGRPPQFQLLRIPEIDEGKFVWRGQVEDTARMHIQDFAENAADYAHFGVLHRNFYFPLIGRFFEVQHEVTWEPHPTEKHYSFFTDRAHLIFRGKHLHSTCAKAVITFVGSGGLVHFRFYIPNMGEIILFKTFLPVEPMYQVVGDVWYADKHIPRALVAYVVSNAIQAFKDDIFVWENKTYLRKPMLVKGDGPIFALRRWYKQFFTQNSYHPYKPACASVDEDLQW